MGGPLSETFSNICLTKMENEIVRPLSPPFFHRYVDDIINRRKVVGQDTLFHNLNKYHTKLKFTLEVNPEKFLDTKLLTTNNIISTHVYRKPNKLPSHWSSKVPKRYKRNAINGDLYRAFNISSDFEYEKRKIRSKFQDASFPPKFIESVIKQFDENQSNNNGNDDDGFIIPPNFFELPKPFILLEVPYCENNERVSRTFIKKFHHFTNSTFDLVIKWKTKKIKNLFRLKDRNPYPASVIYEGTCEVCNVKYIGETERNTVTRWKEHDNPTTDSEPARHIKSNITHQFEWKIIMSAPTKKRLRKNLEAGLIALKRPQLNDQIDSKKLTLFRNGVT